MAHNPPRREERQVDQDPKPGERSIMRELVPLRRPTRNQVLWAIGITVAVILALAVVALLGGVLWVLLDIYINPRTATERKDLVQSFAIVVAGVIGSLSALAAVGNLYISRRNLQQQRELELERAQEDALPAYLDQMVQLLNDEQTPLRKAKEGDEVSILARVRTLTVLPRLDGNRKASVMQFLYEVGLIYKEHTLLNESALIERRPNIVSLQQADLREANLSGANLEGAHLSGAHLEGAHLRWAHLSNADLSDAHLINADLIGAKLGEADLSDAHLSNANLISANLGEAALSEADLGEAALSGANLSGTNLEGADLRWAALSEAALSEADLSEADLNYANLSGAHLEGAHLRWAHLSNADLSEAHLINADLSEAHLSNANLEGAHLKGADLSNAALYSANLSDAILSEAYLYSAYLGDADLGRAKGVTNEQLSAAKSLEGATMPDGQTLRGDETPNGPTFEEWRKDKEARKKDGKDE
jgi:uncharacterized protein YjbI with pentapeptide repeats